jgi:hypothetical protein
VNMKRHVLICSFICRWVGESNEVVRLGSGRFEWHIYIHVHQSCLILYRLSIMGICPNVNMIQFLLKNDILEQKLDIWLEGLGFS